MSDVIMTGALAPLPGLGETSRSIREALETITCPKCGAEPGKHCDTEPKPQTGKNPMHVHRMTAPSPKENA